MVIDDQCRSSILTLTLNNIINILPIWLEWIITRAIIRARGQDRQVMKDHLERIKDHEEEKIIAEVEAEVKVEVEVEVEVEVDQNHDIVDEDHTRDHVLNHGADDQGHVVALNPHPRNHEDNGVDLALKSPELNRDH